MGDLLHFLGNQGRGTGLGKSIQPQQEVAGSERDGYVAQERLFIGRSTREAVRPLRLGY